MNPLLAERLTAVASWLMPTLMTNAVYAACAALVVVGLPWLLGVRRPTAVYLGWSLVLVRLMLPPGLASSFSLRSMFERLWHWVTVGVGSGSEATALGGPSIPVDLESVLQPAVSHSPWIFAVFAIWLVGSGLVAFVLVQRFRWYRRVARNATKDFRPEVVKLTNAWRARFHVSRPVRVVSSDRCLTPFASGVMRPVIFLPDAMFNWSEAALEPVIAHEMAHISRLDELWTVLANMVRAVHFFNPLAWFAVARLAANRELVCDERVLGAGGVAPDRYARSMLGAMQIALFGTARADVVLGLIDRKKGVAMRLERVKSAVQLRPLKPMVLVAGVLAALLVVLPMGASDTHTGELETASAQSEETPHPLGTSVKTEIVKEFDGQPVYRVEAGGPVTQPVRTSGSDPEYTAEARAARIQGAVVLQVVISAQGDVVETKIIRGLPLGLTEAAVDAVTQSKFKPARFEGRPVPAVFIMTMKFELDDGDPAPISIDIRVGGDGVALEELQRLGDRLATSLKREITDDEQVVQISVRGGQILITAIASEQSSVEDFVSRLQANSAFDEVRLGQVSDREDGSVEAVILLRFSS